MEILDLFNKDGTPLGKTIQRGNKDFLDGEFIKIVTVWIKCKNKYLIQKTSPSKHNEYAVSGGHIPTGSTPQKQALVELKEELGVNLKESDLNYLGNIIIGHVIFESFIVIDDDFDKYKFNLQESEVSNIDWFTIEELNNLVHETNFRKSSALQYEKFIKNTGNQT